MPASRAAFALIRLFSAAVLCLVASHTQADERFLTQAPAVAKSYSLDGAADKQPSADREAFQVPPGFQVERLYDVPKGRLGSWVSITFDDQGRLLACDQDGGGLSRITPAPIGGQEPTKVEKLAVPITSAQGMVCVQGALYLSVNGGPGNVTAGQTGTGL